MNTAVSALVLIVFGLAGFGRLAEFVKDWKFAIGIVHYAPEISKAGESIVDGSTIFEPNKGLDNAETSILGTPLSGVEPETEPMPEEQAPIAQGNSTLDHGQKIIRIGGDINQCEATFDNRRSLPKLNDGFISSRADAVQRVCRNLH